MAPLTRKPNGSMGVVINTQHDPQASCLVEVLPDWYVAKVRKRIIQRARRLIRPNSELTLCMAANDTVRDEMMRYLPT